jgi:hypothetical protein
VVAYVGRESVRQLAGRPHDPTRPELPEMRTNPTPRHTAALVSARPAERRNRTRLRELCDEVLASFRAAHSSDVLTEQDRADSTAILSNIAPLGR